MELWRPPAAGAERTTAPYCSASSTRPAAAPADTSTIMEVLGRSSIRATMDNCTFVRLDSQRPAFDRARGTP
ncbi:hypothetical protein [Streptomyces sp. NPDC004675]|uniref:hypothetical protein n=1 Tax=Streptomyces sp. NPDC004675 TaxID=3154286 RepID=UPI0033A310D6